MAQLNFEPTKKQLDFIAEMQDFGCPEFKGTTKKEASEYISRHIEYYKLQQLTSWDLRYI